MSYDFEAATHRNAPMATTPKPQAKDLEAIVVLLELAAIYLASTPEAEFTLEELLSQVRTIGGDEIGIEEGDVKIVLDKASFLKKVGKRFRLK
jgi:hypothetical protein